jgi:hypothetical protein
MFADRLVGVTICRRYPPGVTVTIGEKTVNEYPVMLPDDWCGEYRWKDRS